MALASKTLGEALGLRRGEPLADFTYAGFFDAERTRLDELILVCTVTQDEDEGVICGEHVRV